MAERIKNNADELPVDQWLSYRFGLLGAQIGRFALPMYKKKHRLNMAMWRTLAVTARFQPLSSKALGEHSSLDPFSVARAIDALRKRGLINRNIDPADKRRVILTTTKKGDAIYHDVARFAYNVEQALTSDLTKREKESFDRILSKIERRISEMTAQSDWKDYFEG